MQVRRILKRPQSQVGYLASLSKRQSTPSLDHEKQLLNRGNVQKCQARPQNLSQCLVPSDDAISIVDDYPEHISSIAQTQNTNYHKEKLTFSTPLNATPDPHARVQMQIPRIARLHADVGAEAVGLRIDLVRLGRVLELLEDVAGAHAPAVVLDDDVGGRVVVGLEAVFGFDVGGEVGGGEVGVLTAGLDITTQLSGKRRS